MIFLRVSIVAPGLFHALARSLPRDISLARSSAERAGALLVLIKAFALDLQVTQLNQLLVPASLQFAGNQTIIGVDRIILPTRPGSLVLGLLDSVLDLLALVVLVLVLGLHRGQCGFDPKGLQAVQHFLSDDAIDPHPAEADAIVDGFGAERAFAGISLRIATFTGVLNVQSAAAARAAEQARQQGLAASYGTTTHIALSIGVVGDQVLVPFELGPRNIASW